MFMNERTLPGKGQGSQSYLSYARDQLYRNKIRKKQPPYSVICKRLIQNHTGISNVWGRSADHKQLTITIGMGSNCWNWAEYWQEYNRPIAILPTGHNPSHYDWAFTFNFNPVLIETIGNCQLNQVNELAYSLLTYGIQSVIHLGGSRYLPSRAAK